MKNISLYFILFLLVQVYTKSLPEYNNSYKMFARQMGWGYWMQNPGAKFLVFIRHTPLVQSYIWPNKTRDINIKKERFNRETEQIVNQSFNCVVKISSINQLTEIMSKEMGLDFQIFHFF
jgi:hypothetical protein